MKVRTANQNRRLLEASKLNYSGTELEQRLKAYSLLDQPNGTHGIPFGAGGLGINGAAGPDMMHQYLLGIMKRCWQNFKKLLMLQPKWKDRADILDTRFDNFNSRHSGVCATVSTAVAQIIISGCCRPYYASPKLQWHL
jgi:hypothetical protein